MIGFSFFHRVFKILPFLNPLIQAHEPKGLREKGKTVQTLELFFYFLYERSHNKKLGQSMLFTPISIRRKQDTMRNEIIGLDKSGQYYDLDGSLQSFL